MKIIHILILAIVSIILSCQQDTPSALSKIQNAHGLEHWKKTKALQSDLKIQFGEKVILEGRLTFETNGGRTRLDLANSVVIFDGKSVFVSPADATIPRARFHSLTWSWFLAAPYKITGPGTYLSPIESIQLPQGQFLTTKQTFGSDQGDTPDDWYQLYFDPKTHMLKQMAYIVTYGKTLEQAEKSVSVIQYEDYIKLNGVSLSTHWKFSYFSLTEGLKKPKGEGFISNLKFIPASDDYFRIPEDSQEVLIPQTQK